ncbi:hypothetical protein BO78DRAFT_412178 [Aspergillus sclerotiicarbonarius CBS 121057]|uniref:DRBM domain-containing protein n=1 Tax=Aspergillus sclerotiicarbonarius (strain CBS 121057 / IBT 28362) TaxID=1448318 RepID=A0A319DS59_ASPSB|nr:hypothetical protein BO78DRAFT_412178 [Aspergillus sclerotiicarbonarius CBS 121057]
MYYILYLASEFSSIFSLLETTCISSLSPTTTTTFTPQTKKGYICTVLVNNRSYQTDSICETETRAQENAAMRAYLICRNFSVNDGMYPVGVDHGGVVQGVPVAIGVGRRKYLGYEDEEGEGRRGGRGALGF